MLRVWKVLSTSSLDANRFPETNFFRFRKRWKSEGAKSGWQIKSYIKTCSFSVAKTFLWADALSLWKMIFLLLILQVRPPLANFDIQLVKKVRVIFSCNCPAFLRQSINRIPLASQNTLVMTFPAIVINLPFFGAEPSVSTHCFDCCLVSDV